MLSENPLYRDAQSSYQYSELELKDSISFGTRISSGTNKGPNQNAKRVMTAAAERYIICIMMSLILLGSRRTYGRSKVR